MRAMPTHSSTKHRHGHLKRRPHKMTGLFPTSTLANDKRNGPTGSQQVFLRPAKGCAMPFSSCGWIHPPPRLLASSLGFPVFSAATRKKVKSMVCEVVWVTSKGRKDLNCVWAAQHSVPTRSRRKSWEAWGRGYRLPCFYSRRTYMHLQGKTPQVTSPAEILTTTIVVIVT